MAKIKSSIALLLAFANLFGGIAIFSLLMIEGTTYYSYNSYRNLLEIKGRSHNNLRGRTIKLMEIKTENKNPISQKNQKYDPSYYTEDEFVLPKNNQLGNTSKPLRKLYSSFSFNVKMMIYLQIGAFFFTFVLWCSFCLTKNECCNRQEREEACFECCFWCCVCDDCECTGTCNCDCRGDGNGAGIIVLLVIIIVFVAIFFAIRACGKHVARYISIVMLFLVNIGIFVFCKLSNSQDYYYSIRYQIPIFVISGILVLSNFLGLLLPNLSCCQYLTYGYRNGQMNEAMLVNGQNPPIVPVVPGVVVQTPTTPPTYSNDPLYPPKGIDHTPQMLPTYPPSGQMYPQQETNVDPSPPVYPPPVYPPPSNSYNSDQGNIYTTPGTQPVPQGIYPKPQ